jgi:hypothetical protein
MTRNAALAKRKRGMLGKGKDLEGKGEEVGLVQIERTGGSGARTVEEVEVDHGSLMAAGAATLPG